MPAVTADAYEAEPPQIFTNPHEKHARPFEAEWHHILIGNEEDDADVCRFGF